MKKLLSLLALMCLFCTGAWADDVFRYHRYDTFKSTPINGNSIVFVGNSITNMHPWVEAFGNDPRIVNRGCSGATSAEILREVRSYCVGQPAKIFLMIGINDKPSSSNQATVANNILETVRQIRSLSPNTMIYVQSILPSGWFSNPENIKNCNTVIQQLLTQNYGSDDHVMYLDVYSQLLGKLNTDNTGVYSFDMLHTTAAGYAIWTDFIKSYVGINPVYPSENDTKSRQLNGDNSGSWGARATYFSMLPIESDDILFFGDEMVHGGEWQELLGNVHVKNRGTSWDYEKERDWMNYTKNDVKATFTPVTGVSKVAPKQVLLYTGTGEVNGTGNMSTIVDYYKGIVSDIRSYAPSTKISLVSLMPTTTAGNARVKQFNDLIRSYAYGETNVEYIDIYSVLATNDNVNTTYFPANNNYLYGKGYVAVANVLKNYIDGCSAVTPQAADEYRDLVEGRTGGDSGNSGDSDIATEITEGWYQIEVGSGTGYQNYHQQYKGKYINSDYRVSGSYTWAMGLTDDKTDYRTYVYVSGSENAYNIQFNRGGYSTYAPFYAAFNCTKTTNAPNNLRFIPNAERTEWKIWGNGTNRWMGWDLNGPSVGSSSTSSAAHDNNYFIFHKVDASPVVPEVGKRYKACVYYSNGTKKYFTSSGFSESADAAEIFNVQVSSDASYPYIFVGESGKCLTSSGAQSVSAGDGRTLMKYGDMATVAASNNVTMPASMRLGKIYLTAKQRYSNTNLEGCLIVNMNTNVYDNSTAPYMNSTYTSAIILEEVPYEDEEFFEEGWYQIQVGEGNFQAHSTYKGQYIYSNPHMSGSNNWALGVTSDNTLASTYVYITGSHNQWHIEFNHGTSDAHYTTTNALYATTPCNLSFVPNSTKTEWKIKNAGADQYWCGWNLGGPSIGAATYNTSNQGVAQCYFKFIKTDAPAPHTPIEVTYTFTVGGEVIGNVVRQETTNTAPTITDIIPTYARVISGLPTKVTESAYTVETEHQNLPFTVGADHHYYMHEWGVAYRHYLLYANNSYNTIKELKQNQQSVNVTAIGDNVKLDFIWSVGGDWLNGFTFKNTRGYFIAAPSLNPSNGANAAATKTETNLCHFDPFVQATSGKYSFRPHGGNNNLAHTSDGSLSVGFYNAYADANLEATTFAFIDANDDYERLIGNILALQAKVDAAYENNGKVGYPDMTTIATYTSNGVNDATYDAAETAYNALLASTDVKLPEDGKAYRIHAVHVNADGTLKNDYVVYSNEDGKITASATGASQTYSIFVAKQVGGNNIVLVNELGNYLNWCDSFDANKSYDKKGSVDTYNSTFNDLKFEHANKGSFSLSDRQLFGCFQISGHPKNNTAVYQYFCFDNGNNQSFVSGNPGDKYYNDNGRHTFLFMLEEVENLNIVKLTNPNPAGNSSLDGKFVGTFSAPYNVELTNGVKAYTGVLAADGSAVVFTLLGEDGTIVPKNTGVLVYAESATDAINDFAIPAATAAIPVIADGTNIFLPTGRTGATLNEGDLVLGKGNNGVGFYKINPAKKVVARNKAYIPATALTASVGRYVFDFDVDGSLTGINGFEVTPAAGEVYDLQGRRVQNAQKGLYIINCKKVVR